MSCCSSGGCCEPCGACKIFKVLTVLVLTLVTIVALVAVWKTLFLSAGMSFGTLEGSAALFVLVFAMTKWLRLVRCTCPCSRKCCEDGKGESK